MAVAPCTAGAGGEDHALFCVFDGHGGEYSAKFAALNLTNFVDRHDSWSKYLSSKDPETAGEALRKAFVRLDNALKPRIPLGDISGCTACAVLLTPTHIICANAGDTRAVIKSRGMVTPLSEDHKPDSPNEYARICSSGGFVKSGRVMGELAVSRALGDYAYKKNPGKGPDRQPVSCDPEIRIHTRCAGDETLVLACDGIWDVMSNTKCIERVHNAMGKEGKLTGKALEIVLDECLGLDSMDNMSIVAVDLRAP